VLRGRAHLIVPVSGCCLMIGAFSLPGYPTIRIAGHFEADSAASGTADLGLLAAGCCCCLAKLGRGEGLLMGCCRLGSKTKLEVDGELLIGGGGCLGSKLKLGRGGEVLTVGCCLCSNPLKLGDGDELLMGCCCCLCSKPLIGMGEEL
jgi:hypothetical protein